MGLKERAAERRKRMVGHVAKNFKDAEDWDLDFWQSLTPQERVSVLVDLHEDYQKIKRARAHARTVTRLRRKA
jgi:hypothetical protein